MPAGTFDVAAVAREAAAGRDPPDGVVVGAGEPKRAVWAGRDALGSLNRTALVGGHHARRGDSSYGSWVVVRDVTVGEPQRPVGTRGDVLDVVGVGVVAVDRHGTVRRHPSDHREAAEPERPVGAHGDGVGLVRSLGVVVRDDAGGGDPPDRVVPLVGEPQCAVRASRDALGVIDRGSGVVRDRAGDADPPDRVVAGLVNHSAPSGPEVMPCGSSIPEPCNRSRPPTW